SQPCRRRQALRGAEQPASTGEDVPRTARVPAVPFRVGRSRGGRLRGRDRGDLVGVPDPLNRRPRISGVVICRLDGGGHRHRQVLSRDGVTINRTVKVTAGAVASVVVSTRAAEAAPGWITISAPFEMRIRENGTLLGTTSQRLMVPSGAHTFEVTSDELEFTT